MRATLNIVNTKSAIIVRTLAEKRRRGAKVQDLSAATGIPVPHMGSYIAEVKRVYNAQIEYAKKNKRYTIKNLAEVRNAILAAHVAAQAKASQEVAAA